MMRRTVLWIFAPLLLVSACGSAPKHARVQHSPRHASRSDLAVESRYHRRGTATSEDDSQTLEDIIYDSLGHKRGSGVRYSRYDGDAGKFDIPMADNEYVQKWIDYFTGKGREHFARYLARSGRFIPYMHAVLQKYGVPNDLVYLSMIESGFNTRANSWASAVGPWQFIRSTGAMYGLNVDYYVDERRDVEKSTHAAAQHLKDLHDEFGDWYLAFAAYNAGAGKVRNAIARNGNNFWDMVEGNYLRQETKDYVPKILAAAIISKNPTKYGFREVEYQIPIDYEKVKMISPTDLGVAAQCAGVDADLVRLLNPELLQDMTPPHIPGYALKIPRGTRTRFMAKYASLDPAQRMHSTEYVVARGDSLNDIASRFGVSEQEIARANPDSVEMSNVHRTEKVKVYGRHGRAKWENRSFTVARYEVSSGARLTIPRGRSGSATDSMRDDAAARDAKGRFGLDIAKLEGPTDEKGKGNKKNKKGKDNLKPAPEFEVASSRRAPAPAAPPENPPARAAHPDDDLALEGDPYAARDKGVATAESPKEASSPASPGELVASEIHSDSRIASAEKNDANRGTPLAFNNRPAGAVPAAADTPSDAQLQQAVENVRKTDDLAISPTETGDDTVKEDSSNTRSAKPTYYTVRRGETLAGIADKYGVTVADLKEWNAKQLRGGLKLGTRLVVYGEKSAPVVTAKGRHEAKAAASPFYTVRRGDSLAEIAAQHDVTVADLKKWNGSRLSGGLQSGQKLIVSSQAASGAASSASTRVAAKTGAKTSVVKYKVKPGDNLTLIARKHDTTTDEILKLNGLRSPKVVPGAILLVRKNRF